MRKILNLSVIILFLNVFMIVGYADGRPYTKTTVKDMGEYYSLMTEIYNLDSDAKIIFCAYKDNILYKVKGNNYKPNRFLETFDIDKDADYVKIFVLSDYKKVIPLSDTAETVYLTYYNTEIPSYVTAAAENAAQRLREWAGDDTIFTAIQITDVHKDFKQISYLNSLSSIIDADIFVHNGDFDLTYVDNTNKDWDMFNKYLYSTISRANNTKPWIFTNGNHDSSVVSVNRLTNKKKYIFDILNKPCTKIKPDTVLGKDSSYGYVDFDEKKIRLIFVNTTDTKSSSGITTAQYDFIASALKSVPNDYNIVFTGHIPPNENIIKTGLTGGVYSNNIANWYLKKYIYILNDFNEKLSKKESLSGYDFSSVSENSRIVCSFHGHTHFNAYEKLKINNNDRGVNYFCRQGYGWGYGSTCDIELPSGIIATYDRFDHNKNCLFDIIAVKVNSNTAKVIRIGQGAGTRDFEFSW